MARGLSTLISAIIFIAIQVRAAEGPTVFDTRRSLPMNPNDPIVQDYYVSAGSEFGFKSGQAVSVYRDIPVHDPIQNRQQATMTVFIGTAKLVYVEKNMSVARLSNLSKSPNRPIVDLENIMIGDRIDGRGVIEETPATNDKKEENKVEAAIKEISKEAEGVKAVLLETPKAEAQSTGPKPASEKTNVLPSARP